MIISHSRNFVFVHIQKTAGTSITRYLDQYLNYQDLVLGCTKFGEQVQPSYRKKFNLHKHSCAKDIKELTGDNTWDNYFTFSIVRNPWDRVVSLYNWCRKGQFSFPICQEAIKASSFSQFIRSECFKSEMSQIKYITDETGKVIVDFVIRQESIQEDFDYVCQKLQVQPTNMGKLKHNARKREFNSYRDYYKSEDDIKIVTEQFSEDIKLFDYRF